MANQTFTYWKFRISECFFHPKTTPKKRETALNAVLSGSRLSGLFTEMGHTFTYPEFPISECLESSMAPRSSVCKRQKKSIHSLIWKPSISECMEKKGLKTAYFLGNKRRVKYIHLSGNSSIDRFFEKVLISPFFDRTIYPVS